MKKVRKFIIAVVLVFIINCIPIDFCFGEEETIYPKEINGFAVLGEVPLYEKLDFTINTECSKHMFFDQVSAHEDGSFIIFSRSLPYDGEEKHIFQKRYIDIYDSTGAFVEELSFIHPSHFKVELTNESIIFYSSHNIMTYNVTTKELKNYEIEYTIDGSNRINKMNSKNEFECGDWKYKYRKNIFGECVKLTRTNVEIEQTLVEMSGVPRNFSGMSVLLRIICTGGGIVFVVLLVIKWRKKNKKIDTKEIRGRFENTEKE